MDGKENTAAGASTSMTDNTLDTNDRVRKFWERLDQYHTATQVPGKSKDSPSGNIVGGGGGGGLNTAAHVMQEGARSPSSSPSSSSAARPDGSPGASSPATDADVVYKKVPTPIVAMSERLSRTLDELRADSMTRGPPPPPPPPRASTSCTTDESEDTSETSTYGDNDDDAEFEEEEEELEFHLEEVEDDDDDEEADDEDDEEDEEEVRHMLQSMMRDNKQMQEDVMNAIFKAKREMHARRANDMQHRQYQDARNVLLHRRPMAHDGNSDTTSDDGEASIDQFPLVTSTDHNQATNNTTTNTTTTTTNTNTNTTTTSSSLPAESSPMTQVISRFDELEQAYNRVTKILLSTRVLNESSVGLGTFPKDLPQVEKAAKFSDELDLLVEAERVLRATPPRGPTLEVLRTQHAEVVVGLSDKLHGQCDQALKDLRSVEDRMRMVDGKQRLLADRKADLVRVVKDCESLRLEIEEVTDDMRKRASQVSARELAMEDKLRSLRETEARHRARSEESEELRKTATAWVKILNEREERLNAKEERLQRIERDLLRRQEDVRLYSGAAHNNGTKAAPIQSFS